MASDEQRLLVRLEATATKLVKEMQRAESETRRRMKGIDDSVTASNRRVTEGLGRSAEAMRRNTSEYRNIGFAAQNAAFQIGDFAVQVASGTSAMRAAAQQAPQFLGAFGVGGAIAGAAFAISGALVPALFSTGEEMRKIDAISLEGVRSRISELAELQQQYNQIVAQSGPVQSEATRQKLDALDQEYQAKLALFRLEVVQLEQRKNQLEATIAAQRKKVDAIAAEIANVAAIGDALDPQEDFVRTRAMAEQLALTQEMVARNESLFLEIRRQSAELDLVNLSLGEAQGLISGAANLAGGLAGAFGAAADEAARLSANIPTGKLSFGMGGAKDPVYGGAKKLGFGRLDPNAGSRDPNFVGNGPSFSVSLSNKGGGGRRGGGGGGGGGGSAANPMDFIEQRLATAQAAADAARVEASAILLGADAATKERAKIELLNEAKRRKLDLDQKSVKTGLTLRQEIDNQAAAIAKLTRETEIYRERAQFMDQQNEALKDGFLDAIVSGKDFGDVLKDVARNLAKAALEAALFNSGPFARPGGGGGGGLGGVFGKLLGGIFGGFRATGGPVNPGKSYVVGENGPEMFTPSRAGAIIPNGAMGGGASGRSVVVLSLSPDLEARILEQSANQSVMIAGQAQRQQTRAFGRTSQAMQARGTVA